MGHCSWAYSNERERRGETGQAQSDKHSVIENPK